MAKFKNFDEMLEMHKDDLLLVDFYANWCGHCKLVRPELDLVRSTFPYHKEDDTNNDNHLSMTHETDTQTTTAAEKEPKKVHVLNIDFGRFPKLGTRFEINDLPTILLFSNKLEIERFTGLEGARADNIIQHVKKYL